ncbi:MAG: DMT family transporter [Pseudomonadota bacterium]
MTTPPSYHPFKGALLFILALFFFTCQDTTTKYLSIHYKVPFIAAIRYIVNCLLMMIILLPTQGKKLLQTQRTRWVILRAACLPFITLFIGLALQRMPVAETTAISFLAPMLVILIARPILGERIGILGWIASLTGFAGVLLIVRPSSNLDHTGIIYVLCAVVASAAYQLLSRVLISTERAVVMLFYTTLMGSICFGVCLPWYWSGRVPDLRELLLLLSLGITGGLGHFLFTSAYQHAQASLLAPITYLQLLWAGLLGWLVFGHVPDRLSVIGMCVVTASGILITLRSRQSPSLTKQ